MKAAGDSAPAASSTLAAGADDQIEARLDRERQLLAEGHSGREIVLMSSAELGVSRTTIYEDLKRLGVATGRDRDEYRRNASERAKAQHAARHEPRRARARELLAEGIGQRQIVLALREEFDCSTSTGYEDLRAIGVDTSRQRAERNRRASELIAQGLSVREAVLRLVNEFAITQPTAYKHLREAGADTSFEGRVGMSRDELDVAIRDLRTRGLGTPEIARELGDRVSADFVGERIRALGLPISRRTAWTSMRPADRDSLLVTRRTDATRAWQTLGPMVEAVLRRKSRPVSPERRGQWFGKKPPGPSARERGRPAKQVPPELVPLIESLADRGWGYRMICGHADVQAAKIGPRVVRDFLRARRAAAG